MSTWMMRTTAQAIIADRHIEAERDRFARLHEIVPTSRRDGPTVRLAGPIAVVAALALLLLSIPTLAAAPGTGAPASPMPSPAPGAAPTPSR